MIEQYIIDYLAIFDMYCQEWESYLNQGNYKKANFTYKKIKDLYDKISIDSNRNIFYSNIINNCKNYRTLSTACTQMLILNIDVEKAEEILNKISLMKL